MTTIDAEALDRWRADPVAFVTEVLVNPETGQPFELYPAQVEWFREALTPRPDGRLNYSELVYAAPKKSGKTATAAIATLYVVVVLGGPFAEAYCAANDLEQAQGRVFSAIARIVKASPLLAGGAKVLTNSIEFTASGATITAIASDYAGAAGSNPTMIVFDELWAYVTEASQRLWDELVPVPTRAVSVRLTVTYAGFEGESALLEGLYKRGLKGEEVAPSLYRQPGMLMAWHHEPVAPWQTDEWLAQMREQLRPNAFVRMIQVRFVTAESTFIDMDWWDACVSVTARPAVTDTRLSVWVGVDASTKRDSTAVVAVAWDSDAKKVRLVWHRIFQPSPSAPLDFEATIEETLRDLQRRFVVREVRFDPWQLVSVAQRLTREGLPMVEFPQSVPNLTAMGSNLFELLKGRNLAAYSDADIRLAMSRTIAIETPRGWRIAKEKASHKIDVVVALAMAALGAVESQGDASAMSFLHALAPPCRVCSFPNVPGTPMCGKCGIDAPGRASSNTGVLLDAQTHVPVPSNGWRP